MHEMDYIIFSEPDKGTTRSDVQQTSDEVSTHHANNYDYTPELVGENNVYEQISLDERREVLNPTSEYEALKYDDYM